MKPRTPTGFFIFFLPMRVSIRALQILINNFNKFLTFQSVVNNLFCGF